MADLSYKQGFLRCSKCGLRIHKDYCPVHKSNTQQFYMCPNCYPPMIWRMRTSATNKFWRRRFEKLKKEKNENFDK